MNIVHIAPVAPYNDYWGYQDNLLPKYQKKLGHNVSIIITNKTQSNGKIIEIDECDYTLSDGVNVYRRKYKKYPNATLTGVLKFIPVFELLNKLKPDFIFYHGLNSYTIFDAIKYKRSNPKCVIVQDNHTDYYNGSKSKTVKEHMIRSWHRLLNKKSIKFVNCVYGVTPWRKTYAEDYFGIPSSKTDVLIMGADDEMIDFNHRSQIREKIRQEYGVSFDDFLIVTGGKIDSSKKIDILMEACARDRNIKLLIFGNVSENIKERFESLLSNYPNIIYIGWIEADKVYNYYFAADLIFFPGTHSVLWEQACASKTPCVFAKWDGMDHVNNGGNSDFISTVTVDSVFDKIKELHFTDKYYIMKEIAESDATDIYLYSKIAEKSLECANNTNGKF